LDIFIDPADEDTFGLMQFVGTLAVVQQNFPGIELGCGTRSSAVPSFRPFIEADAARLF
jgi:hypothetical protein